MAASFPDAVRTFTTKVDHVDYVEAEDVNDLQNEVNAIETYLLPGAIVLVGPTEPESPTENMLWVDTS
jgi:hypothetical protein